MGFLDKLNELELDDDVKEQLRRQHVSEIEEKDEELSQAKFSDRKSSVEDEVKELKEIGLADPGILAYVRRVLLSDDGEAGIILLSDAELELSGDEATGSRKKEEKSTADVLRGFIDILPRNNEGKLD